MDDLDARLGRIERRLDELETARVPSDAPAGVVTGADIRAAYRIFLDREPDEGGYAHFAARAAAGGFGFADLIHGMTDCEEYRVKSARTITTIDMDGLRVAIDPDEPEFGRAIARDGIWEAHVVAALLDRLRPGDTFVDIGANVGIMGFQAARRVGSAGRVVAFEPNQDNVQRFLQGVLLNGFGNVTLFPFAVSAAPAIFSMQGRSNTHLVAASVGGRLAQAVRGDDLLRGEPRVDMIKMDIEGHEPQALTGLAETLRRHRPTMVCEFNPRCLRANGGTDPQAFAVQLFALTDGVEVIEPDGGRTPCADAAALMALWTERDRAAAAGLLHFDLLFRCRG